MRKATSWADLEPGMVIEFRSPTRTFEYTILRKSWEQKAIEVKVYVPRSRSFQIVRLFNVVHWIEEGRIYIRRPMPPRR